MKFPNFQLSGIIQCCCGENCKVDRPRNWSKLESSTIKVRWGLIIKKPLKILLSRLPSLKLSTYVYIRSGMVGCEVSQIETFAVQGGMQPRRSVKHLWWCTKQELRTHKLCRTYAICPIRTRYRSFFYAVNIC